VILRHHLLDLLLESGEDPLILLSYWCLCAQQANIRDGALLQGRNNKISLRTMRDEYLRTWLHVTRISYSISKRETLV